MGSQVIEKNGNAGDGESEEMANLEEKLGSNLTLERVAAAKKFIEGHYKSHMKHIRDRKERYPLHLFIFFPTNLYVQGRSLWRTVLT